MQKYLHAEYLNLYLELASCNGLASGCEYAFLVRVMRDGLQMCMSRKCKRRRFCCCSRNETATIAGFLVIFFFMVPTRQCQLLRNCDGSGVIPNNAHFACCQHTMIE